MRGICLLLRGWACCTRALRGPQRALPCPPLPTKAAHPLLHRSRTSAPLHPAPLHPACRPSSPTCWRAASGGWTTLTASYAGGRVGGCQRCREASAPRPHADAGCAAAAATCAASPPLAPETRARASSCPRLPGPQARAGPAVDGRRRRAQPRQPLARGAAERGARACEVLTSLARGDGGGWSLVGRWWCLCGGQALPRLLPRAGTAAPLHPPDPPPIGD